MGIGLLGGRKVKCPQCDEEFNDLNIVFKRKFRWTIEGETPTGKLEPLFVKVAARPQLDIEETEINFLSAKTWIPGKQSWQEMTVIAWETDKIHWDALQSTMHNLDEGECPPEKHSKFTLHLYDGCGCLLESWELSEAFISKIRFDELDHSASEQVDVELTMRYNKVVYKNALKEGVHPSLPYGGLACGSPHKVTCPKCRHEFCDNSIIF